jgi:IS30 family transposase
MSELHEMWVSAETIYQSLHIQARGGLKRELTATGSRVVQCASPAVLQDIGAPGPGHGDDQRAATRHRGRAVPGHWEGDLIMSSEVPDTSVGTLVERTPGFVMLLHPADAHGTLAVQEALVAKMLTSTITFAGH